MASDMEFRLLGPLTVHCGGVPVPLPRGSQRSLLAALLLNAGRPVSIDALAEILWESPPPSARASLHNHVQRLRQCLGSPGRERIDTQAGGYLIRIADGELDLTRAQELLASARTALRTGEWERAGTLSSTALLLWRGEALADIGSELLVRRQAPRLAELRLQAQETRLEAQLNLGRHAEALPELLRLTATDPLREHLSALLLQALSGCGRTAEALAAYQRIRATLIGELGIEPGPELTRVHQQILAGGPAPTAPTAPPRHTHSVPNTAPHPAPNTAPPRQLPGAIRHFTGREKELAALTALLDHAGRGGGAVVISAIAGSAGIGKTALALQWAHQHADRFPDGQLYVNLRGFDPAGTPTPPASVVRRFLDALGVDSERVPADPEARFDLYRSMLADRRMLIVLDNARDGEQARPLLPGTGSTLVLITSRNQLSELVALDGAVPLTLDVLTPYEAGELLARRLGPDRVARDPDATDRLIEYCARLPLALNIAAAHAATRPDLPLGALAEGLREARGRLDLLSAGGDAADVRAVFSWSIRTLSPAAARMFRLLGLHPGPDISPRAAASLAGVAPARALALLAELTRAHLATEDARGRISLHDLLRAYAAEQAHETDSATERHAAIRRILDHYLITAASIVQLQNENGTLPAETPPAAPGVLAEQLATTPAALDWFTDEYRVLLALVELADSAGFDEYAWQLPRALRWYFPRRALWADWDHTHAVAARAAERLKDPHAEALTLLSWSRALSASGRPQQAEAHLQRALALFQQSQDRPGQARALTNLSVAAHHANRYREAITWGRRAYDLYLELGERDGQAGCLANLARVYRRLGEHDQARSLAERSLAIFRELGNPHGQALAADTLGLAYQDLHDYLQAITAHRLAATLLEQVGDTANLAEILGNIGDAHHAAGQNADAAAAYHQALDLLTALGHPDTARIQAKLAHLPPRAGDGPAFHR